MFGGRSIPDKGRGKQAMTRFQGFPGFWNTRWAGHKEELSPTCRAELGLLCFVSQHAADPRTKRSKDSSEVSGETILTPRRTHTAAVRSLAAELAC